LVAAAGGSIVVGMARGTREMVATAGSTWCICVFILLAQALKWVQDTS
jgi:hypothetical protein